MRKHSKGFWAWWESQEERRKSLYGEGPAGGHWVWSGSIEDPGKERQIFLGKDFKEAQENMSALLENDRITNEIITS